MSANGTKNSEMKKIKIKMFCCQGHLASGCAVMSKYFLEITIGVPVSILGANLGCYSTVRNKNSHNETNKKGQR